MWFWGFAKRMRWPAFNHFIMSEKMPQTPVDDDIEFAIRGSGSLVIDPRDLDSEVTSAESVHDYVFPRHSITD